MRFSSAVGFSVFTALLIAAFSPTAMGCGCVYPTNVSKRELVIRSVEAADEVFLGAPVSLHGDGASETDDDLVVFRVEQVFKGPQAGRLGIHSGNGTTWATSCGFNFQLGRTYLVFADSRDGSLFVADCSYTNLAEKSDEALRYLRQEPPLPEDFVTPDELRNQRNGSVCGSIRLPEDVQLRDSEIYFWDDSDPLYKQPTDYINFTWAKDRSFQSQLLPPRTYRVTAVAEPTSGPDRWVGFYSSDSDGATMGKVEVNAGRQTCGIDIFMHKQRVYSVRGVVRSADEGPLPIGHVEIRTQMAEDEMFTYLDFTKPESDGTFLIRRVPNGKALLSTYVNKFVDPNWETTKTDVLVSGDVDEVEIVLKRKAAVETVPSK